MGTQAELTNAVTQGCPVEARLATHDTTVGAQAVLASPCATDGIPIFLTFIHVCRESGKRTGMVNWGPACSGHSLGQTQFARSSALLVLLASHQQIWVLGSSQDDLPSNELSPTQSSVSWECLNPFSHRHL